MPINFLGEIKLTRTAHATESPSVGWHKYVSAYSESKAPAGQYQLAVERKQYRSADDCAYHELTTLPLRWKRSGSTGEFTAIGRLHAGKNEIVAELPETLDLVRMRFSRQEIDQRVSVKPECVNARFGGLSGSAEYPLEVVALRGQRYGYGASCFKCTYPINTADAPASIVIQ